MRQLPWLWSIPLVLAAACEDTPRQRKPPRDAQTEDAHTLMSKDAGSPTNDAASDASADAMTDAAATNDLNDSFKPTNTSFEAALSVDKNGKDMLQSVVSATQVDYFKFEGEAGEFVVLSTERGNFSPDNVLSLYDAEHTLIAQNDVGSMWPGDKIDTRLVVRLPASGTYYVSLHDPNLDEGFFEGSFPLVFYHFKLLSLAADTPGFARADDNALQFSTDMASGFSYLTLIGTLEPGHSDRFTFTGLPDQLLVGQVLADGSEGNGSSAHFDQLRVSTSRHHTLALIDGREGQSNFRPPLPDDQEYELSLSEDAATKVGDNGFYAVDVVILPDNPREQLDQDNNTREGAEALMMNGSGRRRGLMLAHLPADDVDYYGFEAFENESAVFVCEAQSGGSGVRGLHAELRGPNDEIVIAATETESKNALIDTVALPGAGSYYLRLSNESVAKDGDDDEEPWVRCAVLVGPS